MPAQLTLHVDADDGLSGLVAATVTDVCAPLRPAIEVDIAAVRGRAPRADRDEVLALPALSVTDDPLRRVVGGFTTTEAVERALGRLLPVEPPGRARVHFHPRFLEDICSADDHAVIVLDEHGLITFATATAADLFGRPPDVLIGLPYGVPGSEAIMSEVTLRLPYGGRRAVTCTTLWGASSDVVTTLVLMRDRTEEVELRERLALEGLVDPITGLVTERALIAAGTEASENGAPTTVLAFEVMRDGHPRSASERLMLSLATELSALASDATLLARVGPQRIAVLLAPDEDPIELVTAAMRPLDQHDGRVLVGFATATESMEDAIARAFATASAPEVPATIL